MDKEERTMSELDKEKREIGDSINQMLGVIEEKKVDWTKLSLPELVTVYKAVDVLVTSKHSKTKRGSSSSESASPMDFMPDKIKELVGGLSESQFAVLEEAIEKRKDALDNFPIVKRFMNNWKGDDKEKEK